MWWLHIVLGVTLSHDPLLQKAYDIQHSSFTEKAMGGSGVYDLLAENSLF